jgi:hypothetical protein
MRFVLKPGQNLDLAILPSGLREQAREAYTSCADRRPDQVARIVAGRRAIASHLALSAAARGRPFSQVVHAFKTGRLARFGDAGS